MNIDPTQQLTQVERICSDIITREELAKRLAESASAQQPLRVKFGIDPTFTDVHIGHAVPIRLLSLFQEMGHLPVLIIGDGTARLGDPTGRNDQRPPLSAEVVAANSETYLQQIGQILDLDSGRCEVRHNSEWFGEMDFFESLQLAAKGTAARLLERDDFKKRMKEQLPIHLHEMMYPLMQGWDSVKVEADIEIGGNDQLFNLHMGRQLQERGGLRPQVCLTVPLLMGTDGRKMSKTYGNHIALCSEANDVFGKVMSLSDEHMSEWFRLLTSLADQEVEGLLSGHPREAKGRLAHEVTAWLHSEEAATSAAQEFSRRFRDKELPSDMDEVVLEAGARTVAKLLCEVRFAQSTSEARRLVKQGAVSMDGEAVGDPVAEVTISSTPVLVKVGKRRICNAFSRA